jgi:DNA-binding CsgD family transcriptional regulator
MNIECPSSVISAFMAALLFVISVGSRDMDNLPDISVDWLTAREIEVLRAIALGLSAKEVAKQLKIAPRTVERHIDHIRLKTRTRNRSHMVAFAIAHGLV